MIQQGEIINKVAQSGIITLNPEDYIPKNNLVIIDIKDQLFQGLILREKDFREFVKNQDWEQYRDRYVAITCSTDAIIPAWAYMLLASTLQPVAAKVISGNLNDLIDAVFIDNLDELDFSAFQDKRVVLKGCGNLSPKMYVELTIRLRPYAKSIMYGEPCSTVPVYKR